jgi:hypothetical protein
LSRCSATTRAGEPCRGVAIGSSAWCPAHHPEYADARRRRASKGGKRGGRGRPSVELANIKDRLQALAEDVLAGDVDKGDAAVAGQLLNTVIRAIGMEMRVREVEELAREVEELRDLVEAGRSQGARSYGA